MGEGENDSDESKIYVKLTLPLFALNFLASIFKMKLLLAPAITSVFFVVLCHGATVKRQSEFGQIGQVFHSLFGLFSTLGAEGGKFVSKQVEVNHLVVSRVGDISETIHESEFARSVHQIPERGMLGGGQFLADNVNLASNTVGLVSSVSCALLCPNMTTCNIPCTP